MVHKNNGKLKKEAEVLWVEFTAVRLRSSARCISWRENASLSCTAPNSSQWKAKAPNWRCTLYVQSFFRRPNAEDDSRWIRNVWEEDRFRPSLLSSGEGKRCTTIDMAPPNNQCSLRDIVLSFPQLLRKCGETLFRGSFKSVCLCPPQS